VCPASIARSSHSSAPYGQVMQDARCCSAMSAALVSLARSSPALCTVTVAPSSADVSRWRHAATVTGRPAAVRSSTLH